MDIPPLPSYRSLLRELFWTRTGLLVLVTILVGLGLLWLSSALGLGSLGGQTGFALGTGLVGAAVFTCAQTLIADSAANRVLVEALGRQTRTALRELTAEYRAMDETYLPTHVFEGSPRPDPTFNRRLTRDLAASKLYLFRGLSGRHTAARLLNAPAGRWEVRVIIADLRSSESLHDRARYLANAGHGGSFERRYEEIRQQVRYGLVGLYQARLRCAGVSVTVSPSPSLDRFEIFDHSVWVTMYSDTSELGAAYPRSLRFSRESFVYTMQYRDFERGSYEAPGGVIDPAMTEAEFLDLFARLTGERIGSRELARLAGEFDRFQRGFVAEAGLSRI